MQTLIDYGISIVIALQSLGDWLTPVMIFFTRFGNEDFFFLVLPLIYWSIDASLGIRVGFILITSNFVNLLGKLAFMGPRPYWVSSHVRPLWAEPSLGLPSNHAQNAMSVWGIIATYRKRPVETAICVFLIFIIGLSRIYLGSHFPHDVILGWLIGAVLLWVFLRLWDGAVAWLQTKTFTQQVGIAFGASMLMVVIGLTATSLRRDFQVPQDWITNALRSGTEPAPVDPNGVFTSAGTLFGLAFGAAWIHTLGGYQATGPIWKRAVRYLIGLVGVILFWQVLGGVFPRGDGVLVYSLRFVRYSLVGWWIAGGAPWVFKHFNLTTS